eukprot:scaffold83710_cov32-Tisochrysis_lutea.AAC.2
MPLRRSLTSLTAVRSTHITCRVPSGVSIVTRLLPGVAAAVDAGRTTNDGGLESAAAPPSTASLTGGRPIRGCWGRVEAAMAGFSLGRGGSSGGAASGGRVGSELRIVGWYGTGGRWYCCESCGSLCIHATEIESSGPISSASWAASASLSARQADASLGAQSSPAPS